MDMQHLYCLRLGASPKDPSSPPPTFPPPTSAPCGSPCGYLVPHLPPSELATLPIPPDCLPGGGVPGARGRRVSAPALPDTSHRVLKAPCSPEPHQLHLENGHRVPALKPSED